MATRERLKAEKIAEISEKRPHAIARYIRISSFKVRIVLDQIRGMDATEAEAFLKNTRKAACPVVLKVLKSAIANGENNMNLAKEDLFVAECYANDGPVLKRVQPRARGSMFRILKRTSHITVVLDTKVRG